MSPNVFIWNYVTNFADYLVPHPNMNAFAEDLRFFSDNHVVGVFEQGDAMNPNAGDFLPLRLWLLSHLMWDPSRDQTQLRDEFLSGYYGPAGPQLGRYLDLVNACSADPATRIYCGHDNTSFLSSDALAKANDLFDAAESAVKDQPVFAKRVARERLALRHVELLRTNFKDATPTTLGEYRAAAKKWVADSKGAGVRNYSEAQGFESYAPAIQMRGELAAPPKLPPAGTTLPSTEWDIQQDRFTLYQRGDRSDLTDDAKASDGHAARMQGAQTDWAIQYMVRDGDPFTGPGPWIAYLVVRCDVKAKGKGAAFLYGLHDASHGSRAISLARASLSRAGDGEYHTYPIAVENLKPGMYFYVAPLNIPQSVSAIYVDRIFIRKQNQP
jgi:hypothetical protein